MVAVATDVVLIKEYKSFVNLVVAYVVWLFVTYLVSILVVSSCKEPCNTLCNMCCNNTLVDCAYCYEKMFKWYV